MEPNLQSNWNNLRTIIISILPIIFFLYTIRKLTGKSKFPKPPEVAGGWPIIGHLSLLGGPELPHIKLGSFVEKYGPIFSIRVGINSAVVINSWELAKECFTTHDADVSSRPKLIGGKILGYNYAMFAFGVSYGPYWRKIRKIVTHELLSNRRLELIKGVRSSEINDGIKELYDLWKNGKNGDVLVEMKQWFRDLNMNLIMRLVAGKRNFGKAAVVEEEEARRCQKAISEFMNLIGHYLLGDAVPYLGWLDYGGHVKAMKKLSKELDEILNGWLEDHKERGFGEVKQDKDFMDEMLSVFDNKTMMIDDNTFGFDADTIIKATCLTIALGGSDTTAIAVTWALSLLLNNRWVLRKVQEELDTHIGRDRKPNETDIGKLVYLQAVVKETMRLYSAGGLFIREASEDFNINGFHIQKGTWLFMNMWKIHMDERVWPEPSEFKPERFLTTHKDLDVKGQHFELIPFGGGRRICPGLSFGLQMVQLLLANLLHAFDMSTPEDTAVDMTGTVGMTNMKATPLEVLIRPRLNPPLYLDGRTGGSINLIFNSISPDSTSQSFNQTLCVTSPSTQLMMLSLAMQLLMSGVTFLNVVCPEETPRTRLNRADETIGLRLSIACPILSSALKRSLSNTSCRKKETVWEK